jgi:hypothetical protein
MDKTAGRGAAADGAASGIVGGVGDGAPRTIVGVVDITTIFSPRSQVHLPGGITVERIQLSSMVIFLVCQSPFSQLSMVCACLPWGVLRATKMD